MQSFFSICSTEKVSYSGFSDICWRIRFLFRFSASPLHFVPPNGSVAALMGLYYGNIRVAIWDQTDRLWTQKERIWEISVRRNDTMAALQGQLSACGAPEANQPPLSCLLVSALCDPSIDELLQGSPLRPQGNDWIASPQTVIVTARPYPTHVCRR